MHFTPFGHIFSLEGGGGVTNRKTVLSPFLVDQFIFTVRDLLGLKFDTERLILLYLIIVYIHIKKKRLNGTKSFVTFWV